MFLSLFLLFLAAALSSAGLVWLFLSVPQLMGFVEAVTDWCRSVMVMCLPYASMAKGVLLWSGMALLGAGFLTALGAGLMRLLMGLRTARRLPLFDMGLTVALIKDDSLNLAFTRGLFNPKIYVSTGLLKSLTREELRAVVRHEAHHRDQRDPLVFFLLSIIRDLFFYLPIAGFMVRRFMYRREINADDSALSKGCDRLHLASALLKTARAAMPAGRSLYMQPVSIRGDGALEKRVKRLVGERVFDYRPTTGTLLSSIIVAALMFLSLSLSFFAPAPSYGACDLGHCSGHVEEIGTDCRVHCAENEPAV